MKEFQFAENNIEWIVWKIRESEDVQDIEDWRRKPKSIS